MQDHTFGVHFSVKFHPDCIISLLLGQKLQIWPNLAYLWITYPCTLSLIKRDLAWDSKMHVDYNVLFQIFHTDCLQARNIKSDWFVLRSPHPINQLGWNLAHHSKLVVCSSMPSFTWSVHHVSTCGAKYCKFDQILIFRGFCKPYHPFTDQERTVCVSYVPNFRLIIIFLFLL